MSIDVNKHNFEFLSKLKGGESVGIDKGKLVLAQKTTAFASVEIQKIAEEFVKHRIKESPSDEAVASMDVLAKSHLLNDSTIFELTKIVYDKKYEKLLEAFEEPSDFDKAAAEAIVATEMSYDQHVPEEMRKKLAPELKQTGTSGTYILKNREAEKVGIFKPQMQEYGMPLNPRGNQQAYDPEKPKKNSFFEGHIQGTGWLNEIGVYILDGEIGIPETMEISVLFQVKNTLMQQKGSFQKYIDSEAVNLTKLKPEIAEKISPFEIQKIALLDILTSNCDRNMQNILYKNGKFIPIDHGLSFRHEPNARGIWFVFPQVKEPIDKDLKT